MQLKDMYGAVLIVVLIGILLGVGLVILGTLSTNSAITAVPSAVLAINQTILALGTFGTWMGIIVLIIAAAIVIGIVMSSFGNRQD